MNLATEPEVRLTTHKTQRADGVVTVDVIDSGDVHEDRFAVSRYVYVDENATLFSNAVVDVVPITFQDEAPSLRSTEYDDA